MRVQTTVWSRVIKHFCFESNHTLQCIFHQTQSTFTHLRFTRGKTNLSGLQLFFS